ncbi:MAG: ABC transporter permease [Pseudomonadales bacterium]
MIFYAFKRLLSTIPVLWFALTLCFIVLRLAPGGPLDQERSMSAATRANLEAHYNLDKPLVQQYLLYLKGVVQGDLGPSFVTDDFTVTELLLNGLPYTFVLGMSALVLSFALGVTAGIISALWQNRWPDYLLVFVVMIGLVFPNFLIAPILQLVFGLQLKWLPVGGWGDGNLANLVLPVLVMSLPHIARISKLMRGSLLDVLGSNFIRTAKAKGIGARLVMQRHAIRPALLPVVSYLGPATSYLLTGSLVVESIFGLPGIGRYFVEGALSRDYGMVLGTVIFYMVLIIILNLIVDLIYAFLDPKVRYQ